MLDGAALPSIVRIPTDTLRNPRFKYGFSATLLSMPDTSPLTQVKSVLNLLRLPFILFLLFSSHLFFVFLSLFPFAFFSSLIFFNLFFVFFLRSFIFWITFISCPSPYSTSLSHHSHNTPSYYLYPSCLISHYSYRRPISRECLEALLHLKR